MGLAFGIKYKGQLLDLLDETVLTVEWYSTLFNEAELFRGSYSYAVDLALTAKNKTLLGMPHLLENRLSRQKIEVSLLLFGHTWKRAVYDYEVQADRISGNLLIDNAIIADWLRDTTLPDVFSYYDGTKTAYETIDIGSAVASREAYMNNTATAEAGSYPMAFPGLYNYGWNGEYKRWMNSSEVNVYYAAPENSFRIYNLNYFYCPMFYLTWLIEKVCSKMGFVAEGTFMENREVRRWIIYNTSYYTGVEMYRAGFKIVPSRHLPKITIGTLFKILRNDLKLCIYFDSLTKKAYFNLPNDILSATTHIDMDEHLVRKSIKIKNSVPKRYVVKMAQDEGDLSYAYLDSINSMILGESTQESTTVELSIDAPKMHRPASQDGVQFYRWPMVEQMVNLYDDYYVDTEMYNKDGEISKNSFSFRLLSYRGLEPYDSNVMAQKTSYATSDNRNALGVVDNTIIATDPVNENSWLRKYCEPFYQMQYLSEQIEADMYVPIQIFALLSPLQKGMIRSQSGAKVSLLFDRITFEPHQKKSLLYAKVKAYSISNANNLMGGAGFKIGEKTNKENVVYIAAWFDQTRIDGYYTHGKVRFNFYSDKYCQTPMTVDALRIDFEIMRYITTSSGDSTLTFERGFITGSGVSTHLFSEEFAIECRATGSLFYSEIILMQNDFNKYVPVL